MRVRIWALADKDRGGIYGHGLGNVAAQHRIADGSGAPARLTPTLTLTWSLTPILTLTLPITKP